MRLRRHRLRAGLGCGSESWTFWEAESLVNDGTGLLALQFGLLILVTGHTPSVVEGVGRLVFLTGGGVLVGLAIGAVVAWFEKWVDDGPIEIVISILVPYAAYLMGDRAHVSGVIAVIACSMYMSRKSPEYMSPQVPNRSSSKPRFRWPRSRDASITFQST